MIKRCFLISNNNCNIAPKGLRDVPRGTLEEDIMNKVEKTGHVFLWIVSFPIRLILGLGMGILFFFFSIINCVLVWHWVKRCSWMLGTISDYGRLDNLYNWCHRNHKE